MKIYFYLVTIVVALNANAVFAVQSSRQNLHNGRITKSFTEPIEKSIAASPEVGIIAESFVKEGDRVAVGDRLAAINQNVLRESLAIAIARSESTARLDSATSQLELIKSQLEAIESLVTGGHTNKFEVQQKQAEYQVAFAELRTAQDEIKLNKLEVKRIQAQINDRIITSPINGFVTELHKQLGENISNNEPQYATVVRVDELKVRFYLDSSTLKRTGVGDTVTVLLGKSKTSRQAIVTYVSPIIDPDSGLGRLDAKIDNRDLKIQSGIVCFWQPLPAEPVEAQLTDAPVQTQLTDGPIQTQLTDAPVQAQLTDGPFAVGAQLTDEPAAAKAHMTDYFQMMR